MKENVIQDKSYDFALRILRLHRYLVKNYKEGKTVSTQILRCVTSIGANVEEAEGGQSGKDFHAKMTIAYKEARETSFWLRLLHDGDYLDDRMFNSLFKDCEEILKILGSIQITMKNKINRS
ncbi:MAG: four helix bundle protein [Ignavibacteriae bacterium]|nr:MAG: four helix bundle protein [Ignavibacteriota bacterium]